MNATAAPDPLAGTMWGKQKRIGTSKSVQIMIGYDDYKMSIRQFLNTLYLVNDTDSGRQEVMLHDLPPRTTKVMMQVGTDVNMQDIRCQLLDKADKPIEVVEGNPVEGDRVDVTIRDRGLSVSTMAEGAQPAKVVCDPTFRDYSKPVSEAWRQFLLSQD